MYRVFGTILLLALAAPSPAQTAPAEASSDPTVLKQTVNNVLVDVVVIDKYGRPVKGLGKEHFKVIESGTSQAISYFEEHQTPPPPTNPPAPALKLPPDVYTNFTTTPDTSPVLVLLLDGLNTPTADQVKVRLAMLQFLKQIPAGTHIAIFTLNSRLRMLQGFTGDADELKAALAKVEAMPKQSILTDDPGQDTYADAMPKLGIGGAGGGAADVMRTFVANEQAWRIDQRVGITLDALNALGAYLSPLSGRKNLIWFSGAFPLGMGPDFKIPQGMDGATTSTENLGSARNFDEQLRKTADLLQLARVAVYPMQAGGLATPSQFSSAVANNGSLHSGMATISQSTQDAGQTIAENQTMDTLADSTGGRAFHGGNDLATAIRAVAEMGANYYTLAFVPKDGRYDSKYRKLDVKVDVPKAKLEFRRGYYADDPKTTGADKLANPSPRAAVLLRGAPEHTQILFKVRVAPAAPTSAAVAKDAPLNLSAPNPKIVRYSVNWIADIHGLVLPIASNGLRHGGVELVLVAYDQDGKPRNSTSNTASLILQSDEYQRYLKTGLPFHQELDLPVGLVYLRLAILDTASDRAGSAEIPLTVRPLAAAPSSGGK